MSDLFLEIPKKEKKKEKGRLAKARIFLVPIIVIVVFFIVLIGWVIPRITSIFNNISRVKNLTTEIALHTDNLNKHNEKNLMLSDLSAQLNVLNTLAPSSETDVVLFQRKITQIAGINNLTVVNQALVERESESAQAGLSLKELLNTFTLIGSRSDLEVFITALDTIDDFVVVEQMRLNPRQASNPAGEWALELQLLKYQFSVPANENLVREQYRAVPIDASPSKKVEEIIKRRLSSSSQD